ncbi:hypothetical protein K458DRAFT_385149 [Lentithecium fluviatile CBS 122367]|uniref:Uncharacterized protein n=1 Tax=Lentithecium fluviatile CBS 122367 TaxID=1168545 RepID=A0A6G1JEX5_9PLEO|nr:hypothetical protein K458DRAFT_385149 [Lentithecium fluviatile CBS 122367]
MLANSLQNLVPERRSTVIDIPIRCILAVGTVTFFFRVWTAPELKWNDLLNITIVIAVWYSRRSPVIHVLTDKVDL